MLTARRIILTIDVQVFFNTGDEDDDDDVADAGDSDISCSEALSRSVILTQRHATGGVTMLG